MPGEPNLKDSLDKMYEHVCTDFRKIPSWQLIEGPEEPAKRYGAKFVSRSLQASKTFEAAWAYFDEKFPKNTAFRDGPRQFNALDLLIAPNPRAQKGNRYNDIFNEALEMVGACARANKSDVRGRANQSDGRGPVPPRSSKPGGAADRHHRSRSRKATRRSDKTLGIAAKMKPKPPTHPPPHRGSGARRSSDDRGSDARRSSDDRGPGSSNDRHRRISDDRVRTDSRGSRGAGPRPRSPRGNPVKFCPYAHRRADLGRPMPAVDTLDLPPWASLGPTCDVRAWMTVLERYEIDEPAMMSLFQLSQMSQYGHYEACDAIWRLTQQDPDYRGSNIGNFSAWFQSNIVNGKRRVEQWHTNSGL